MATTPQRKSYLEGLVSRTNKFKVEELLDLYRVYDTLVLDHAFCQLLYPHCEIARTWIRDQVRDLIAGTDRNRLILTSRARKASEEANTGKATLLKAKNQQFMDRSLALLRRTDKEGYNITVDDLKSMGLSRLVCDDIGMYVLALMQNYPTLVADYTHARVVGDHDEVVRLDAEMSAIEAEVGVHRDHAWYVAVNLRAIYDSLQKQVQHVCLAYARLLFRFAHQLRGVTTTEENFSAGYQGLVNAARNYDPSDGSSFTAHCAWWVKSAILTRQRQSSVIQLPTTTKHQLSWAEKNTEEVSAERLSALKGRVDMFFTTSGRGRRSEEDSEEVATYDAQIITSPDADVVLGSSYYHAQQAEEGYQSEVDAALIRDALTDIFTIVGETDPALVFPFLLWSLNAGIDASLLAESASRLYATAQRKAA